MSDNVKATIVIVVMLSIAILVAYITASSVSTEQDTEELVTQLQTISQQKEEELRNKKPDAIKPTEYQENDITIALSCTKDDITLIVSASLTEITTIFNYDWNITSKSVHDLSSPFVENMVMFTMLFIVVNLFISYLVLRIICD